MAGLVKMALWSACLGGDEAEGGAAGGPTAERVRRLEERNWRGAVPA